MRIAVKIYERDTDIHLDSIQFDTDQIPSVNDEIVVADQGTDDTAQTFRVRKVVWFVWREADRTGKLDGPAIYVEPVPQV